MGYLELPGRELGAFIDRIDRDKRASGSIAARKRWTGKIDGSSKPYLVCRGCTEAERVRGAGISRHTVMEIVPISAEHQETDYYLASQF
jgi:hypothetical protein